MKNGVRIFSAIALLIATALFAGACDEKADENKDYFAGDDSSDDTGDGSMPFPEGFLFGAATSGFQIEMGCPTLPAAECVDPNTDWYEFVTTPEIINDPLAYVKGDDPAVLGPGFWELYESDLDRAATELHHNAFRLGIEWSRIFPTSTAGVEGYENLRAVADADAVEHYHKIFAALRGRGLTPLVTLNHYTIPTWIHDGVGCHEDLAHCSPRGWLDKDFTVGEIAKYAGFAAREFGSEVDLWTTLNEPFAVLLPGFLLPSEERSNPPAVFFHFQDFKIVLAALIEAHARMVDAVRANDDQDADGDGVAEQIGVVYAMAPTKPKNPDSGQDRRAAENLFYLWNMVYLNAAALGEFDENLDGNTVYRDDLAGRMDFVGLNYYARITVEGLPFSLLPWLSPLADFNPLTLKYDEVYPRGIYEMTKLINEDLGCPVYITENNARADPNDDQATEMKSMVEHLSWLWYAIQNGADVRGYFYWSLLDNYEWNQGMKDYGLYGVDIDNPAKPRFPRDIATVYGEIARAHGVPPYLAARYQVGFQ